MTFVKKFQVKFTGGSFNELPGATPAGILVAILAATPAGFLGGVPGRILWEIF